MTRTACRARWRANFFRAVKLLLLTSLGACATTSAPPAASPALPRAPIAEIVASPDRSGTDRSKDVRRKPEQMLAFIGVHPGMVALDLSAGPSDLLRLNGDRSCTTLAS